MRTVALMDYVATASDEGVLKLPARTELDVEEVKDVFGYARWGCAAGTDLVISPKHGSSCGEEPPSHKQTS